MLSKKHLNYNNLEANTYFRSTLAIAAGFFGISLCTTTAVNLYYKGALHLPKDKINIERYINDPKLTQWQNFRNLLGTYDKGIWICGEWLC